MRRCNLTGMSEIHDRYVRLAEAFDARLRGLTPQDWGQDTPCAGWTVRDLVAHVIHTQRRCPAALDGTEPDDVAADADLMAEWERSSQTVRDTLADPAKAGTSVQMLGMEMPLEQLVATIISGDTLIHTWDLSRATGQDERLDPEAVEQMLGFMSSMGDTMRTSGAFGPAVESAPGADQQTRMLNLAGRAV